jgi:hypothetical protein
LPYAPSDMPGLLLLPRFTLHSISNEDDCVMLGCPEPPWSAASFTTGRPRQYDTTARSFTSAAVSCAHVSADLAVRSYPLNHYVCPITEVVNLLQVLAHLRWLQRAPDTPALLHAVVRNITRGSFYILFMCFSALSELMGVPQSNSASHFDRPTDSSVVAMAGQQQRRRRQIYHPHGRRLPLYRYLSKPSY